MILRPSWTPRNACSHADYAQYIHLLEIFHLLSFCHLVLPSLQSPQVKWHIFPQTHFLPLLAGTKQSTNSNIFIKYVFRGISYVGYEIDYIWLHEAQICKSYTEENVSIKKHPNQTVS